MKNLSRLIRFGILAYSAIALFFYVTTWLNLEFQLVLFRMRMSAPGLSFEQISSLSTPAKMVAALLDVASLAMNLWAMRQLWKLLAAIHHEHTESVFSSANIRLWQSFSGGVLAATALSIIELPVRGLLFSALKWVPGIKVEVSISSEQLMLLLFCLLSYLVAQLFHSARRLEEENKEFV